MAVRFFKVVALPTTPVPNAFYFVQNGNYAESYLTDHEGNVKKMGNTQMVEELTKNINAGFFT